MRQIKFRAWDKINKKIYPPIELMQFIGLYDIKGKEIYEGDIVKFNNLIGEIIWDQNFCSFIFHEKNEAEIEYSNYASLRLNSILEVIGNIYENPELLENKEKKNEW